MPFTGRVVVVAGGTGALGRAVSLAFLEANARVVVTARRPEEVDALRREAGGAAGRLSAVEVDLADADAVSAALARVARDQGGIDTLVNAAGAWAGGAKVWETDPALFDRMIDPNLRSTFALARGVMPHLLARRRGWIVGVASRAAAEGQAGSALYAAAKGGLVAFLASLAAEVKDLGVNVNCVVPATLDTPANRAAMPGADAARWARPEDVARAILFLCGEGARAVHGAAIPVFARE
jgi:NAD(P)-dependent dehydrogenase (short-subunit alcohol dehydrogenase family)